MRLRRFIVTHDHHDTWHMHWCSAFVNVDAAWGLEDVRLPAHLVSRTENQSSLSNMLFKGCGSVVFVLGWDDCVVLGLSACAPTFINCESWVEIELLHCFWPLSVKWQVQASDRSRCHLSVDIRRHYVSSCSPCHAWWSASCFGHGQWESPGLQEAFDTRHVFYMAGTCVWLFIIADCNMSSGVCTAFVTSWFLIGSQPYCLCTLLQMMWTRWFSTAWAVRWQMRRLCKTGQTFSL